MGGNTKTLMISCISPADDNYDETLSTLRYANRAKNIQNRPRINQDAKDTLLKEYQQEIERLRKMVEHQSPQPIDIRRDEEEKRLEKERFRLRSEYEDKIQALQKDIEREQETNAKATSQLENLRRSYQDELSRMKLNSTPVIKFQQLYKLLIIILSNLTLFSSMSFMRVCIINIVIIICIGG